MPATVLWGLKRLALDALGPSEKAALALLDGLLVTGIRGVEVPVLACLWQMILVHQRLIRAYAEDLHGYGPGGGTRFGAGQLCSPLTLLRALSPPFSQYSSLAALPPRPPPQFPWLQSTTVTRSFMLTLPSEPKRRAMRQDRVEHRRASLPAAPHQVRGVLRGLLVARLPQAWAALDVQYSRGGQAPPSSVG